MKQKDNENNNFLFENYYETRSYFLDAADQEKIEWSNFYVEKVYLDYFKSLSKDAAIADMGCGKGFILNALSQHGFTHLTGVDLSKGDIVRGKKLFPYIDFVQDDMFSYLEKNTNTFDVIILKAVIEHVKKEQVLPLLQKLYGALKSGGFLLVDVYNADWFFMHHDRYMDFTHETGFTQESLEQVMRFSFDNVKIKSVSSPLIGKEDKKWRYKVARKIIKTLFIWAEPEMAMTPFLDRLLIGYGKKL